MKKKERQINQYFLKVDASHSLKMIFNYKNRVMFLDYEKINIEI